MRFRNGMTSVVGTALAVVAAGSLVLFSVVLQRSAFDATGWRPLDTRKPQETATTTVQVPGFEENTEGGSTVADLGSQSGAPLPPDAGDLLSPFPSDELDAGEGLVADLDEPPAGDGDNPTVDGGTGVTGITGGPGPSLSNGGPQATINNDLTGPGKPGHEPLPVKDGPKLVNPPHEEPGDGEEDEADDSGSSPDSLGDVDDPANGIRANQPGKHGKQDGSNNGRHSKDRDRGDNHDRDRDRGNRGDDHDRDRDRDRGNRGDDHDRDRDRGNRGDDHDRDRDRGNRGDDHDRDRDHGDNDSKDHGDNDSKDRDSKSHKASKTPKAHQPKPPEPKGDDDDNDDDDDDDGHGRDHSDHGERRGGDDSSGD